MLVSGRKVGQSIVGRARVSVERVRDGSVRIAILRAATCGCLENRLEEFATLAEMLPETEESDTATRLSIDPRQRASNRRWLSAEHSAADELVAAVQENAACCAVCRDAPEAAPPWILHDQVELIIRNAKFPYRVHLRRPTPDAEAKRAPMLGFVTTSILVAAMRCDTRSVDGAAEEVQEFVGDVVEQAASIFGFGKTPFGPGFPFAVRRSRCGTPTAPPTRSPPGRIRWLFSASPSMRLGELHSGLCR